MVRCVICGLALLYKNRGIGGVTIKNIAEHYVEKHAINPEREPLKIYLKSLMEEYHEAFIPFSCICNAVLYLTAKELAIHQLREGCDLVVNVKQTGGARVSFFEDADAPVKTHRRREKIISDEEVEDFYTFTAEEVNVESIKMYNLKYMRLIDILEVKDMVLPPLAFLNHAVENIRQFVHKQDLLKDDNGEWLHGKVQLVIGINNTQNNSIMITTDEESVTDENLKPILLFANK